MGSFLGLLLLGATYAAIGIFASLITDNIIVSFILGAVFSFLILYSFDAIAMILGTGKIAQTLLFFSLNEHYQSIRKGIIDSRDISYFILIIALFLFISKHYMEKFLK